jgi:hypothetical protein
MSAELSIQCADGVSLENLLRLCVVEASSGDAYVTCENNDESWESILKRCIVVQDDGTYAIQVYIP